MEASIQGSMKTPRSMGKENTHGQMEISTQASGTRMLLMEKVSTGGTMAEFTVVNGERI